MRILIDLQCVQSGSRLRGIGRYATSLTQAMIPAAQAAGHELHLLLNAGLGGVAAVQRTFSALHGAGRIHVFPGLPGAGLDVAGGAWRKAVSARIREAAIAGLAPDVVFCPSLFEGETDSFVSLPAEDAEDLPAIPRVATVHDLIPLADPARYLDPNPRFAAFFQARLADLPRHDRLIAISASARAEVLAATEIPGDRVTVIPEDAGPAFGPMPGGVDAADALRARMGLDRPYLLHIGSAEPRKNVFALVEAWAALPEALRARHDLVLAGPLTELETQWAREAAERHGAAPGRLVLAGHVAEADLPMLYAQAALFVMPSAHEGFGLPALEAMRCGTPVVGADRTALREVIVPADARFDPDDIAAMTAAIRRGLEDAPWRGDLVRAQAAHAARFSWDAAAEATLAVLAQAAAKPPRPMVGGATGTETAEEAQTRADAADGRTTGGGTLGGSRTAGPGPAGHGQPDSWTAGVARIAALTGGLADRLAALPETARAPAEDLDRVARALATLTAMLRDAIRPRALPVPLTWRLEGPIDSSYSLATVNRETARALAAQDVAVSLVSAEGPGPYPADPAFLAAHPDLAAMVRAGADQAPEAAFVTSRNMFPPRSHDIASPLALLHGYAWEETGLPLDYARDFNAHLQGALVTAPHVARIFRDQGIAVPLAVVGNGVDHLDIAAAALPDGLLPVADFMILHVSSCFPRKGPDVLLAAFAAAFGPGATAAPAGTRGDIALVIKTHPNPHNDIHDQVTALRARHPDLPPIRVIEDDLTPGQMRSLYAAADLLVAPSRAEGFCLPVAEAVLAGTPALTTGWSGQRIFEGNPLVQFCDYDLAPADSHLGAWNSVWADPDVADLTRRMRAARTAGAPDAATAEQARRQLLEQHSWAEVARRSRAAVARIAASPPAAPPRIGWVSTFNARCGIATYSAHLIAHIPDEVTVFAAHAADRPEADQPTTLRCWHEGGQDDLRALAAAVEGADPEVLVIQFNFGFFSFPHLEALIARARQAGRQVVMMMHATDDSGLPPERRLPGLARALRLCSRILVHSVHDMNRLKRIGLTETVTLFPHGVPQARVAPRVPPAPGAPVTLASYGFLLPQKGFPELLEAVAGLRATGRDVRLHMVNAEYPVPESQAEIATVRDRIRALNLEGAVRMETRFLPDAESLARLAAADLLVFPYRPTQESASGAVRQALAVGRPVAVTPLPIFDDVADLVLRLPGASAAEMTQGLGAILDGLGAARGAAARSLDHAADWRAAHAYSTLGPRLWRQLCALVADAGASALHP